MRYDKLIFFQKIIPGQYDENTGNYEADTVEEDYCYASVTETTIETMKLIYGSIKQGSKTIHLQNKHPGKYDRIRIGNKAYQVDYIKNLKQKQVLTVSEIQGADTHGRSCD